MISKPLTSTFFVVKYVHTPAAEVANKTVNDKHNSWTYKKLLSTQDNTRPCA